MQAPVPFIVGVQYKTDEVRSLCGGLVRVNMYKDQVSIASLDICNGSTLDLYSTNQPGIGLKPAFILFRKVGRSKPAHNKPCLEP